MMKLIYHSQLLTICSDGGGAALDNETKPPFQFPHSDYAGEILNHSKPSRNHSTKSLSATTSPPTNSYSDKTVNMSSISNNKYLDNRKGFFFKFTDALFSYIMLATNSYFQQSQVIFILNGPKISDKQKTFHPAYKWS